MHRKWIVGLQALVLVGLAACGGGGGSSSTNSGGSGGGGSGGGSPPPGGITYTPGVYPASSTYANQCQTPRTGVCPWGGACPDKAGSALTEKYYLRSWTNELYLWYNQVPDSNPATATGTVQDYFDTLKTNVVLPSGQKQDRFHFTYNTADYYSLSQSGVTTGFGIDWAILQATPPRKLLVQEVQAGGAAESAGVTRGAEVATVDGYDIVNDNTTTGVNAINAALFAPGSGTAHSFKFLDRGTGTPRMVTLTAAAVTENPVPVVKVLTVGAVKVGYLLFNDHIATAESALNNAIQTLAAAPVSDLVLDMRYNGGGYLDIASELAYMIAGPGLTGGKTFEKIQFNDKHPTIDPVTGKTITPTPFWSTGQGFSVTSGTPLPSLNLPRVFVLTSGGTCSASEAVINGLRGAGITVYQFGDDTCGKPYGFYPQDNCGTTYFSIEFKGVNDQGFGEYPEGFSATRTDGLPNTKLPGCAAADDFNADLGDPAEAQLATALYYYNNGNQCPATPLGMAQLRSAKAARELPGGLAVHRPDNPFRDNRILR